MAEINAMELEVYPVVCTTGKVSVWTTQVALLPPALVASFLANPVQRPEAASS